MKISKTLRNRIIEEYLAKQTFEPKNQPIPFPTPEKILEMILSTIPYTHTPLRKQNELDQTQEIWIHPTSQFMKLPRSVARMKQGITNLCNTTGLELHGGEHMSVRIKHRSPYLRHTHELEELKRRAQRAINNELNEHETLQQAAACIPKIKDLSCVTEALAHEKQVRAAAKERRKNEVLVPIETKIDTSTATAKARLLGAKFLN